MSIEKSTHERILSIEDISKGLFRFTLTRPAGFRFEAGQFARLGLEADDAPGVTAEQYNPEGQSSIFRAYSVVSSPYADTLEFLSVKVPGGAFTERLSRLKVGDQVWVEKAPYGFLTLSRYQSPSPQTLWLLATGTGVAPFISVLQDFRVWEQYEQVCLVYSARTHQDLAYIHELDAMIEPYRVNTKVSFRVLCIATQDQAAAGEVDFTERMTGLIDSGALQKKAGMPLDESAHVMLCGNPQMITDVKECLKQQGLTMNRRGVGNIAVENYW